MADWQHVLALDISGSRAFVTLIDAAGTLTCRTEVPNRGDEAADYWPRIRAVALDIARRESAAAVGISFGGPVSRAGRILSIHVGGWSDLDPAADLAAALRVPVVIENDANCGAVGEARFGTWGAVNTLVFMTCSTGIGGGIYTDGELHRGTRGLAGEVGHNPVAPDGLPCPCGSRGCLEAQCSGTAIAQRATLALDAAPTRPSALRAGLVDGGVPGAQPVFAAAAAGDALAGEVLNAVFADFGRGIAAIHNALDPDLIVIGGGVALAGRALTAPVARAAEPWLMSHQRGNLRLEAASLKLDSQLYGAAALAMEQL